MAPKLSETNPKNLRTFKDQLFLVLIKEKECSIDEISKVCAPCGNIITIGKKMMSLENNFV